MVSGRGEREHSQEPMPGLRPAGDRFPIADGRPRAAPRTRGRSPGPARQARDAPCRVGDRAPEGSAAMIMPVTLAVITSTFPEEQRGKAIGVWTGVAGGGGILGMFLAALLVDVADWRWLFVLPAVLVLVALAMTLKSVPDSRETSAHRFDTVGALVSVIAVTGLIFVLQEGPERGWTAPETLTGLTVGLVPLATSRLSR
ncbi:hypothetical protein AMK33_04340 [Streptomyces sp. CB02400]|nr:hypothetical protein AMK33_04340 [Streptomyces sp. CB02400]